MSQIEEQVKLLVNGRISRRTFIKRLSAAGVSVMAMNSLFNTAVAKAETRNPDAV